MAEYIKKSDAINAILHKQLIGETESYQISAYNAAIRKAASAIGNLPTLGVVHCKDCKHYKTKYCSIDIWHEAITIYRVKPDDFCSRGVCKEET